MRNYVEMKFPPIYDTLTDHSGMGKIGSIQLT
jgi:hypothetical protein